MKTPEKFFKAFLILGLTIVVFGILALYDIDKKKTIEQQDLEIALVACQTISNNMQGIVPELQKHPLIYAYKIKKGKKFTLNQFNKWYNDSYSCTSDTTQKEYIIMWVQKDINAKNSLFSSNGFIPFGVEMTTALKDSPNKMKFTKNNIFDNNNGVHVKIKMIWALEEGLIDK